MKKIKDITIDEWWKAFKYAGKESLHLLAIILISVSIITGNIILLKKYHTGISIVWTGSDQNGIYLLYPSNNIHKGGYLSFCPPFKKSEDVYLFNKLAHSRGGMFCKNKGLLLLKSVYAESGDVVSSRIINESYSLVTINNIPQESHLGVLPFEKSVINSTNKDKYQLKENEYYALGKHPYSFDSRYYGVVTPYSKAVLLVKLPYIDAQGKIIRWLEDFKL